MVNPAAGIKAPHGQGAPWPRRPMAKAPNDPGDHVSLISWSYHTTAAWKLLRIVPSVCRQRDGPSVLTMSRPRVLEELDHGMCRMQPRGSSCAVPRDATDQGASDWAQYYSQLDFNTEVQDTHRCPVCAIRFLTLEELREQVGFYQVRSSSAQRNLSDVMLVRAFGNNFQTTRDPGAPKTRVPERLPGT